MEDVSFVGEGGDKTREETRLISIPFVPTFSVTELLCPLHGQNERGCVDEPPNCKQQHRRHFSPRPSFSHLSLFFLIIYLYISTQFFFSSSSFFYPRDHPLAILCSFLSFFSSLPQ